MEIEDLLKDPNDNPLPPDERVRVLLRENARLRRKLDDQESGWGIVRSVLETAYSSDIDIHVPSPKAIGKGKEEVCVIHCTDWHLGKTTQSYDSSVAEQRIIAFFRAVSQIVELRRKTAKIKKCKLLLGGDFVEGINIFGGQAYELESDLVEQMVKQAPEILSGFILSVAGLFKEVDIHAVPGNHGRSGRDTSKRDNYDSVVYEIAKSFCEVKATAAVLRRLNWDTPLSRPHGLEWFSRFNIVGPHEGLLVHGDQCRGGAFGLPYYSFNKRVSGWRTSELTAGFQHCYLGHFHSDARINLNGCNVYVTGSPESDNQYALESLSSCSVPSQRLGFFNEKYGLLSDYPINLDKV